MAEPLDEFKGKIVRRGADDYDLYRYQYATSTYGQSGHMEPGAVLYPTSVADIQHAIAHAEQRGCAVAVRTGGHQFLGASSTSGENIQLDLRKTFLDFEWNPEKNQLRAGVSLLLGDFNGRLGKLGLFLPHGLCSHVGLGGHVQSGGWGMLARAFGLLSDHVLSFELLTADGQHRVVTRGSDDPDERDLFWAVLGGSPGGFGVLTHVTFRPLHDRDHPQSRGLRFLVPYSPERLRALLDIHADIADTDSLPKDWDFCFTILGGAQNNMGSSGLDAQMRSRHPELYGRNHFAFLPPMIAVYAQWANTQGAGQHFDPSFFRRVKAAADYGTRTDATSTTWARFTDVLRWQSIMEAVENRLRLGPSDVGIPCEPPRPMSTLTHNWTYFNVREFELPYAKRTYLTPSRRLTQIGWAGWVTEMFDQLVREGNGCKPFLQFQYMGGSDAEFTRKADDATSHCWRDTTICCMMESFYDVAHNPDAREVSLAWVKQLDEGAFAKGFMDSPDRRSFWAGYGDMDLSAVWSRYYDTRETYDRVRAIKAKFDPSGRFSSHPFGVR